MRIEEGFIVQLEHRQINARGDRLNRGGILSPAWLACICTWLA